MRGKGRVFIWNEHGVCKNPEARLYKNNRASLRVYFAYYKGLWYYGMSIKMDKPTEQYSPSYFSFLPSLTREGYATKLEAQIALYDKHLNTKHNMSNPFFKDLINNQFMPDYRQTKLF